VFVFDVGVPVQYVQVLLDHVGPEQMIEPKLDFELVLRWL
jgi:hypothetical protein